MSQIILSDRVKLVMSDGGIKAVFDFCNGDFDGGVELCKLLSEHGITLEDVINYSKEIAA